MCQCWYTRHHPLVVANAPAELPYALFSDSLPDYTVSA